ncbi:PQQ-dependent sugar dehydrogenase [Streptomyces sp. MnatMP-M17]|uniref:PQQ-dependent sugar dehydrogenase n=1 Tax=unclassified Streptomyces TaxID=2593676 RepID=UPI00081D9FF3|nr:PQQ-dependent sugar dehydrogenase [Streptomyces sp. MnatMP-M17]MYZ38497.1 sugar dehydrogenase [Streptomyces sp. SID4917]SCF98851.1 Glucose/arabinose dehydrogenase, beta-propeller fold [Streptomyces sp. MnatMP-M17]
MKVRTRSSAIIGTICLIASLALTTASADEPAASRQAAEVGLTKVATAQNPIAGTAGPGGTVWIAERAGTVRVLGAQGLGAPVLDISDETTTDGERGLLGIAFDKKFAHFYISFTDLEGTSTVDEFAVRNGKIRPSTRRTVLTQTQPYSNHNGGDIKIGPDGYLYIAFGDGGSGGDPHDNGQNLGTLLGKMLRIDPRGGTPYAIPQDNPFVDDPNAKGEIWAYGLRNPWRFSFDAGTGDLLIADVGQSDWEEIDWAPAASKGGENYGWSEMEGNHSFRGGIEPANHVPPVHEYGRNGLGCSVTGGFVYRGKAIPALKGQYVFSDYCDGTVRTLKMENGTVTGESDLGVNGGEVISFVEGGNGELYVLAIGGTVSRIDPA